MSMASDLDAAIEKIVKRRRFELLDVYSVIAAGLEIDAAMKIQFRSDARGKPFFSLTFSDGSQTVRDACAPFPETP